MKTIFRLIFVAAVTAVAAAPAVAAAQEKKLSDMTPEEAMKYNEKNLSLVVKGLPLVLPSWAVPLYFGMHLDEELTQATTKETKKKKRKKH